MQRLPLHTFVRAVFTTERILMQPDRAERFWLPRHIYLCRTQDGLVLLDIRRDRYFGLGEGQARALALVIEGWPVESRDTTVERATHIARLLADKGLLTRDAAEGKPAAPVSLNQTATMVAMGQDSREWRKPGLIDAFNFLFACFSASWALRVRKLEGVIWHTERRKQNALRNGVAFNDRKAAELVGVFRRLRRFAFTGKDECLFQALALVNFLSRYRVYPTWVIGVKTCPWSAHSWVQEGEFVLDATPEEASSYTPILTV